MSKKTVSKRVSSGAIFEGVVEGMIYFIRGQRVMLDDDLSSLYGVETKRLNEQVRRNNKRFPNDFMFRLTKKESDALRSQIATSKKGKGGRRYTPYVFTEQGVAMLSSVLNSDRAIKVNIAIMRTFIKLRSMISAHKELQQKIGEMEKKYDKQFQLVFKAIRELFDKFKEPLEPKKEPIGFHAYHKK